MKKHLLILTLCLIFLSAKIAQGQTCHAIHTGYTSEPDTGAVYPATFPPAMAGVPYMQVLTIGVPAHADVPNLGTVTINWIKFKSLKNAPQGMTILDSTGGTNYPQMNKLTWNCFTIDWPNPVAGTYNVEIIVDVNIKILFGNYTQKDVSVGSFSIVVKQYYNIDGYVTYDNDSGSPLKDVVLQLKNRESKIVAYTLTDTTGYYKFENLDTGRYSITALYDGAVNNVNPTDAFFINRNFIKLYSFTDNLRAKAADVNNDNKINPTDAFMINRFFIKLLPAFPAGKWLFESPVINLSTANIRQDIKGICVGDVNGSFQQ
jgi:hypothetical protein